MGRRTSEEKRLVFQKKNNDFVHDLSRSCWHKAKDTKVAAGEQLRIDESPT